MWHQKHLYWQLPSRMSSTFKDKSLKAKLISRAMVGRNKDIKNYNIYLEIETDCIYVKSNIVDNHEYKPTTRF
jgi:hypothetical protein